jgi:hypothetical protein
VSVSFKVTVADKTLRASMVPADEALKTPASLTATVAVAVHCLVSRKVSFATVVVTVDTVPDALANPDPVFSATNAVSVAAKAVVPEPNAKYVNAVGEPVFPNNWAHSVFPTFVIPIVISPFDALLRLLFVNQLSPQCVFTLWECSSKKM